MEKKSQFCTGTVPHFDNKTSLLQIYIYPFSYLEVIIVIVTIIIISYLSL